MKNADIRLEMEFWSIIEYDSDIHNAVVEDVMNGQDDKDKNGVKGGQFNWKRQKNF